MKVKDLRELLITNIDSDMDECEVLTGYGDHSYRKVNLEIADVEKTKSGEYFEYFDKENMFPGSKKVSALVAD